MIIDDKLREDLRLNTDLAARRLADLREQVKQWEDGYQIQYHREDREGAVVFIVDETPRPFSCFSALLSEALHHLTLGFEHIAWRLVGDSARSSGALISRIGMPVVTESHLWEGERNKRLPGMDRRYEPAVKAIQPFMRAGASGAEPAEYDTVILRDFDNAAKHRGHHMMHAQISKPAFLTEIIPEPNVSTKVESFSHSVGYIERGDELLRVSGVDADREVHFSIPSVRVFVVASGNLRMENGYRMLGFPFEQIDRMVRDLTSTLNLLVRGLDEEDRRAASL